MNIYQVKEAISSNIYNQQVDVYQSIDDTPKYIQDQANSEGSNSVEGFFDSNTNHVALIANNLLDVNRALEVVRHELVGHYGVENTLSSYFIDNLSNSIINAEKSGNKTIINIANKVDKTQPFLPDYRRSKEIIAVMAELNMQNDVIRRVTDVMRKFLKEIGFTKEDITDIKVLQLLRDVQNSFWIMH